MKTTITRNEFIDDMTIEGYGFSYDGASLLFDYLEELEADCGTDIEYDPVAFRCEYTEYSEEELLDNYSNILDDSGEEFEDDEEKMDYLREFIQDNTTFIEDSSKDVYIAGNF